MAIETTSWDKFRRLLRETGVITASILMALALESWWSGLADRRSEAEALNSLVTELEAIRGEMLRAREVHLVRCNAVQELRTMIGRAELEVTPDSISSLTRDAAKVTSVNAPLGVLSGLISSGQLSLIRDPRLRSELAGLPERLADHREAEEYMHDVVRDHWVPWLVDNSVLTEAWGRGARGHGSTTAAEARVLEEILRDRTFGNHVMAQDFYCQIVLDETMGLERDLDGLKTAVLGAM